MTQGGGVTVHVYYGDPIRWDHDRLERISTVVAAALGLPQVSPDGFDGLQADYRFATKQQAHIALLAALQTGVAAECCGVGRGPTRAAVDEAKQVGRAAYDALAGPNQRGNR